MANADRKCGGRWLFRKARREMAKRRLAAGSADYNRCGAADHGGSGKDGVRRSGRVLCAQGFIACLLLGRVGLAREESLVDEKLAAFEQSRVRRNEIASNQLEYVAGDHLVDRDRQASAVAPPYGCLHLS